MSLHDEDMLETLGAVMLALIGGFIVVIVALIVGVVWIS